jgi:hypothetical protein
MSKRFVKYSYFADAIEEICDDNPYLQETVIKNQYSSEIKLQSLIMEGICAIFDRSYSCNVTQAGKKDISTFKTKGIILPKLKHPTDYTFQLVLDTKKPKKFFTIVVEYDFPSYKTYAVLTDKELNH